MNEILIGFRAYLNDINEKELEFQCKDAKKYFSKSAIFISSTGKKPNKIIQSNSNVISHLSDNPLGFSEPFNDIINYAKKKAYSKIILVDGDCQHKFSEIKRIFDEGELKKYDVIIPERTRKSLFFKEGKIELNRIKLEEIENSFLRYIGAPYKDFQTGLFIILNKKFLNFIHLEKISSWLSDFYLSEVFFKNKANVFEPKIETRKQKSTSVGLQIEFEKILQLEDYFNMKFPNLVKEIKKSPQKLLCEKEIIDLDLILKYYLEFSSKIISKSI